MLYALMGLAALLIVALDQFTKYLTVANIPLFGSLPAIDGLFHFTHVHNFGAAFSSFAGARWLFVVIFALFAAAIVWEFSKKRLPFTTFDRWCIVAIFAGGLGNVIDRVRLGYVIDMIEVDFMEFAVFNVADCFITCGCVLLIAHLLLFNKDFWKEEGK